MHIVRDITVDALVFNYPGVRADKNAGCFRVSSPHPEITRGVFAADRMPVTIRRSEPLGYLEIIRLMGSAKKILTGSGGVQNEAYMTGVPCFPPRENPGGVETLHDGWNVLTGSDNGKIMAALLAPVPAQPAEGSLPGRGKREDPESLTIDLISYPLYESLIR